MTADEVEKVNCSNSSSSSRGINQNCDKMASDRLIKPKALNNRNQFSSFILFLSVIIIVNLCPFDSDPREAPQQVVTNGGKFVQQNITLQQQHQLLSQHKTLTGGGYLERIENCIQFIQLIFTNPIRLNQRTTRFFQADAKMLGKMAKMWYIKKKIKKLSKKLKKHTIAVPVFTAIPIYEHSYYPQPHVTHVTHGMHHAAAASSYSPAVSPVAAASSANSQAAAAAAQQMVASASNNHQQMAAYRMPPSHYPHHPYHPMPSGSHQIINSYAPSPPLYVDDAGGLYGHYGNAYSRYDGGYHLW